MILEKSRPQPLTRPPRDIHHPPHLLRIPQRDIQLGRTQHPRKLGIVQYLGELMAEDGVHFRGGGGCEGGWSRLGVRVHGSSRIQSRRRRRRRRKGIRTRLDLQPPLLFAVKRTRHPINPRLFVRIRLDSRAFGHKKPLQAIFPG